MIFELITLFPEVAQHAHVGLLGKAIDAGTIEVVAKTPRDHTKDRHRSVDAPPYGGGSGMVMMPGPIVESLEALDARRKVPSRKVLLSPQGAPFTQRTAERFAQQPALTLICGRYEGFDERIRDYVDEEVSLGDFVLLGGESAALVIVEATARLLPGVLGNAHSAVEESHSSGLLEYPQYTRPPEFRGATIPDVLLSGHHAAIAKWRREQALLRTQTRRPDLLEHADLNDEDRAFLNTASLNKEESS